jgi:transposase
LDFHTLRQEKNTTNKTKKPWRSLKKNLQNEIREGEELWFFDESRFGTHSKIGHGWFKKGIRTAVKIKLGFENFYVYSAVNPKAGKEFSLCLPYVNIDCMNLFLGRLAKSIKQKKIAIVMDGAGWHRSSKLKIPKNIRIIIQSAYSPEVNPVEKLWQYIKDHTIKNKIYKNLLELENAVCAFIKTLTPKIIKTVCNVNYVIL